MKRILALFALFCVVAAAPASASWTYDGNDGNNIWAMDGTWRIKFIKNGSTYYVGGWEGGGATLDLSTVYEDLAAEETPHVVPFSDIGNQCFQNNKVIKTLILPARITSIGNNAFNGCTALQTATMPGVTKVNQSTFSGCTSLVDVDCPNLKNIASYGAFQNCTSLVELKVAADMTSFSSDTFRGCTSFTTLYTNDATKVVGHVQLPPGVTSLSSYNFQNTKITHVFAPSVTSISGNGNTFAGCTLLKEAHLPSLRSVTAGAVFSGCTALQTVEISSELSGTLAANTFSGCTSLESVYQSGNDQVEGLVDLPSGVTKLEWGCFNNCKTIERVVAPGLTDIQNRAFTGCTALESVRFSPALSVLHNNNNNTQAAFYGCSALVDFYPSTIPNLTQLRKGMFQYDSSLTNAFDFSGCTLTDVDGHQFFSGASKVPCVKLPASFPRLYQGEFYGMKPGAELHFAGDIPPKADTSKNDQMYAGKNGAGNRYKIFVDAETYPAWTNNTVSGASFTAKTAAMESESDYPGAATLGYLNYASSGQNNWLVQEPFYVDVTFYDDDGTTELGVERTLFGGAPVWTGATPTKPSSPQNDYAFAGWSTDGSTVIDLATLRVNAPMSLRAVYTPTLRSYEIEWQWFDGTTTHFETNTLAYGETPSHEPVERAATTEYTYTFLGWSTDGTTVLDPIPVVIGPATYIAVFEEKDASATVTVRWLDDDGTTLLGTTWPDKNTVAIAPVSPTKESTVATNFTFAGWSTDGTTVLTDLTVLADTDFIAVYTPSVRQYNVAFVNWDGFVVSARNYGYGTAAENVVVPSDPSRPATAEYTYTFSGWDPAVVADVLGDATYTAQYVETPNVYAATFVDGVGESIILGPTNYAYGAAVEAPEAPEHYGFTFSAWSPEVTTMPAADTTYTAVYTTNRYTITWVNGNETTSAKYDYLTPTNAMAIPTGTKSTSSKASYAFLRWEPELESVQSNTTYTAVFQGTVLSPMTLLYNDSVVASDLSGVEISARLANYTTAVGGFSGGIGAGIRNRAGIFSSAEGDVSIEAPSVTATFSELQSGKGYDWTLTATQTLASIYADDVAVLHGRFYGKPPKTWFEAAQAVFDANGVFAPSAPSAARQQLRLRATMTFPVIPSRVHPDTTGAVIGFDVWQPNAGWPLAYYAWNGSRWVQLHGTVAKLGEPVNIIGVVDFAIKGGTMTWYVDGVELTDSEGNWAIPMETSANQLKSFLFNSETATLDSLSSDYDRGNVGLILFAR
ncbi:MAG: leucine-rich repeat protein [Kiritimatiellae bacterium]|nr:leucine-rich repeat protein [Kiritimatiellia bacterium]